MFKIDIILFGILYILLGFYFFKLFLISNILH